MKSNIIILLIATVSTCSALRCWVCPFSRSNGECNLKGALKECYSNEQSCQIHVRSDRRGLVIGKTCKQNRACKNNQIQNMLPSWQNRQCNPFSRRDSVCRCCCNTNGCNQHVYNGDCFTADHQLFRIPKKKCNGSPMKFDLIAVLDSSSSVGAKDWGFQVDVVSHLMRYYKIDSNYVQVGAFRFNNRIDAATEIKLKDGTRMENVAEALLNMPFDGSGTRTGLALEYAADIALSQSHGNRPDAPNVVLLLTDGTSQDDVVGISNRLQGDPGTTVIAVGFDMTAEESSTIRRVANNNAFLSPKSFGYYNRVAHNIARLIQKELCPYQFDFPRRRPKQAREKRHCIQRPRPIINGKVSCSNGTSQGSVCTFSCNSGYYLFGKSNSTTCRANRRWSHGYPVCRVDGSMCSHSLGVPEHGKRICSGILFNRVGSKCMFDCEPGYELDGATTVTCTREIDNDAIWDGQQPKCKRTQCNILEMITPENGLANCYRHTNGDWDRCEFSCELGYEVVGSVNSSCTVTSEGRSWSAAPPKCISIECPMSTALSIKNGVAKCSNNGFLGSVCKFQCDSGHELYPKERTRNTCKLFPETNQARFAPSFPCCVNITQLTQNPCPPLPKIDLTVVIDSSSSIGLLNWLTQLNFLKDFLGQYEIGPDAMRVGIFSYNDDVLTDSEIRLGDTTTTEDLFVAIDNIPYTGFGNTNTGNAFEHVMSNQFTAEGGDRADAKNIVILLTDSLSDDEVTEAARAIKISGASILTIAIGIPSAELLQPRFFWSNAVYDITDGYSGLDPVRAMINMRVQGHMCNPCQRLPSIDNNYTNEDLTSSRSIPLLNDSVQFNDDFEFISLPSPTVE